MVWGLAPEPCDLPPSRWPAGQIDAPLPGALDLAWMLERSAAFPDVPLLSVAIMADATEQDFRAAKLLAQALAQRAVGAVPEPRVVVTMHAGLAAASSGIRLLREAGAFVITAASDVPADHLHHFPARAVTIPAEGQMVGVDLVDHLLCWPAGGEAELRVLPFGPFPAADAGPPGGVSAVCLNFHFDPADPALSLQAIDAFATEARGFYGLAEDGPLLFTTRDRVDGVTGSVDVLWVLRQPS